MDLHKYHHRRTTLFLSNIFRQRQQAQHNDYRKYLTEKRVRLQEIKEAQDNWNRRLYPGLSSLIEVITQKQHLWERRPSDNDFLMVRVGLAPTRLCCPIEFAQNDKIKYVPELLREVRGLLTQYSHIEQQPVVIGLRNLGTTAIIGPHSATHGLLRAMLCQIATFHAPHEVRIGAYFPPETRAEWGWLKWLPHSRRLHRSKTGQTDAAEPLCLLADNIDSFQETFITQIKPELERRSKIIQESTREAEEGIFQSQPLPHLILVLDGFTPGGQLAHMPELEELLRHPARLGVTIILLIDEQYQEPSAIQARLTVGRAQLTYQEMAPDGKTFDFVLPDDVDSRQCEIIARRLAPLTLVDMDDTPLDFSQDIRLLELLNIPSVDTLQVAEHWQYAHTGLQLLRIPIGQQKNGALILDLKEMADGGVGPHGMIIGATGSGKSELLCTIVTGLALTHDPHMVNFVLVDFKSGTAFADFATLPHVAGIITNLENNPALISRMYISLLNEQKRRQNMLSSAGNLSSIKQYQAKWRKNPDMEPMPYLLIIIDEFAQLIANHEEFLALFTSFGQVGRSLGMHMLLSTQHVDERHVKSLDGLLRYRICLRTFKPDESISAPGKPDAYYLPPLPGSGYLKVDDDVYIPFKTALISTPYIPARQQQVDPTTFIRKFTITGKLIPYQQPAHTDESRDIHTDETYTEMNMVIARIAQAPTPATGWHVHPVWQPPLKGLITLYEVLLHCGQSDLDGTSWPASAPFGPLCIPLGMLDRPAEQVQEPVMLDFSGVGGHMVVVGGPQSGKSILLCTIITSLMVTHSPSEVQIYGIDLDGGLLRIFEEAPHIGIVCDKTDREKIRRLIRRIRQIIVERELLFARYGIESMVTYRQLRQRSELVNEEFGDVFLVIDNFSPLLSAFETCDPDIASSIMDIVTTGLAYGIHVIITANQWLEVRPRLRSNIGTSLELRMIDSEESEIDKKQAAMLSTDTPGRGLHQSRLLFQTAWPTVTGATLVPLPLQQALDELIQRMRQAWKGPLAPQIPVLPQEIPLRGTSHIRYRCRNTHRVGGISSQPNVYRSHLLRSTFFDSRRW